MELTLSSVEAIEVEEISDYDEETTYTQGYLILEFNNKFQIKLSSHDIEYIEHIMEELKWGVQFVERWWY